MAEEDSAQEKTEQPTPKRLEKAREEGQVPRSRELNTAAILLAGTLTLTFFGAGLAQSMADVARNAFELERAEMFDDHLLAGHLSAALGDSLVGLAPFFVVLLVASLLGPIALGGWLLSPKALVPKFSRLNPIEGLKRMFSMKALVELIKALAKFLVVATIAVVILLYLRGDLVALGREAIENAIEHSLWIIAWSAIGLSASMIIIVAVDVPFQLYDHQKKLRMTMQQVRDELKDTEGKPEVKGRIRQLQREMARSRMMGKVPKADVVITNPTHFAVALRYDVQEAGAPVVLAKGADLVALKIREIATAHGVPVVSSPALARALYYGAELDREIPRGLYVAVAQVLAYVFQLRSYRRNGGSRPAPPEDLPIPDDLRR